MAGSLAARNSERSPPHKARRGGWRSLAPPSLTRRDVAPAAEPGIQPPVSPEPQRPEPRPSPAPRQRPPEEAPGFRPGCHARSFSGCHQVSGGMAFTPSLGPGVCPRTHQGTGAVCGRCHLAARLGSRAPGAQGGRCCGKTLPEHRPSPAACPVASGHLPAIFSPAGRRTYSSHTFVSFIANPRGLGPRPGSKVIMRALEALETAGERDKGLRRGSHGDLCPGQHKPGGRGASCPPPFIPHQEGPAWGPSFLRSLRSGLLPARPASQWLQPTSDSGLPTGAPATRHPPPPPPPQGLDEGGKATWEARQRGRGDRRGQLHRQCPPGPLHPPWPPRPGPSGTWLGDSQPPAPPTAAGPLRQSVWL